MNIFSTPGPKTMFDSWAADDEAWANFNAKADRALTHFGATANDFENIDVMRGRAPGLSVFVASDAASRQLLAQRMVRQYLDLRQRQPQLQFLFVTIIDNRYETSDELTTLHISAVSKQARRLATKMAPDFVGVVEITPFGNRKHPRGGKVLSTHSHFIVSGIDIFDAAKKVAKRYNRKLDAGVDGMSGVDVQLIRDNDMDLARAVSYLFKAPDKQKTVFRHKVTGRTNLHQSEKNDRNVRFLRLFQIHSMVKQSSLMFAGGQGVKWKNDALRVCQARLEQRTARLPRADQLEWVQDVWGELIPRLKLPRFEMPKIEV